MSRTSLLAVSTCPVAEYRIHNHTCTCANFAFLSQAKRKVCVGSNDGNWIEILPVTIQNVASYGLIVYTAAYYEFTSIVD